MPSFLLKASSPFYNVAHHRTAKGDRVQASEQDKADEIHTNKHQNGTRFIKQGLQETRTSPVAYPTTCATLNATAICPLCKKKSLH